MTDREKLIELIVTTPVPCMVVAGVRGGKSLISASVIADHLLANGVTVQQWTKMKDEPPKDRQLGLFFTPVDGENEWDMEVLCYRTGEDWYDHITHWMPLPKIPKEARGHG